MTWLIVTYHCTVCGESWRDEWCCACDDICLTCLSDVHASDSIEAPEQGTCGDDDCIDCNTIN